MAFRSQLVCHTGVNWKWMMQQFNSLHEQQYVVDNVTWVDWERGLVHGTTIAASLGMASIRNRYVASRLALTTVVEQCDDVGRYNRWREPQMRVQHGRRGSTLNVDIHVDLAFTRPRWKHALITAARSGVCRYGRLYCFFAHVFHLFFIKRVIFETAESTLAPNMAGRRAWLGRTCP